MNKSLGLNLRTFNFIFRVDNVVAKVFVSVNNDTTKAEDVVILGQTAAKTIQAAHKK